MHHLTPAAVEMDAFQVLDKAEISAATDKAMAIAEQAGMDIYFDFNPAFGKSFNTRPHRTYHADLLQQALVRDFPGICFMAATYVRVDPKGFVYPCCVPSRKLRMGNINRASFRSIWNGRAYQKLRKSMLAGRPPKPCRTCKHLRRGMWEA
jgi:radical SAM protein with 4Fe4S-binding SPASM domain